MTRYTKQPEIMHGDDLNDWFPLKDPPILRKAHRFSNGIILSVQASQYHYCTPRITQPDLHAYDSVEIACWHENDDHFLDQQDIPELGEWFNDDDNVAGFVPLTDLPRIMHILRNL